MMTLTIKLDRNRSSFQPANSAPVALSGHAAVAEIAIEAPPGGTRPVRRLGLRSSGLRLRLSVARGEIPGVPDVQGFDSVGCLVARGGIPGVADLQILALRVGRMANPQTKNPGSVRLDPTAQPAADATLKVQRGAWNVRCSRSSYSATILWFRSPIPKP